jgi:hypothetical protein
MRKKPPLKVSDKAFEFDNFNIRNLDDEIVVDQLCALFLETFYHHLVEKNKVAPIVAGRLARGADHFLREFIIPEQGENIFSISPDCVRQFAGNWYIVKTLEPNAKELGNILNGIKEFYGFCKNAGKIDSVLYEEIARNCDRLDYYERRIDSFWEIEGDGFFSWDAECSLKK